MSPLSLNDRSPLRLARDESRNSHTPETAVGLRLMGRSCRRLTPVATVSAQPAVERSLRSSACAIVDRVSVLELSMSLLPFKRGSSTHRRLVWSEMFKMDHRRRLRLDKTLWPSEISCAPESLGPRRNFYLPFRASRRPSSVNAALRSRGLPLTSWRLTHPRSTAREIVAADSPIPSRICDCIGCPFVASYSL